MTFATIVDNFLRGAYPFPMMLLTIIIASVIMVFLSKHMLGKLNIATKTDITQLREATQTDIAQLRAETQRGFQQLKENDLYHTNKAILIMA
ncbi:MAG: hypothetical protein LBC72_03260, partial [Spirochaetaceae bacterium]|nr:hypothetical protein [Spirochaetaceae bacterium]